MPFSQIGLHVPEILFPKKGIDFTKWAVVACDQYTSEHEYWREVEEMVKDVPSTLHLMLPEAYLESPQKEELIFKINENMKEYLKKGYLEKLGPCFILTDRETSHNPSRKGLVVALDLEHYDFNKGSQTLIRATEGTVIERLPPRIEVRKNAALELPHIMVLIDDPEKTVIEPLFNENHEMIADFPLMKESGHIKSYKISDKGTINKIGEKLAKLADKASFQKKYGKEKGVLLFAMGDGNHSLATAKSIWQEIKRASTDPALVMTHPARYALVELVNVHDDGIVFEPIHRVVFNVNTDDMFAQMKKYYEAEGSEFGFSRCTSLHDAKQLAKKQSAHSHHAMAYIRGAELGVISIKSPKLNLPVGNLQSFLDHYLKESKGTTIDYIHGEDVVSNLSGNPGNIGFYLEGMDKHDLFDTVIKDGALPRKTFSMGEADEKRFYLECRKIK